MDFYEDCYYHFSVHKSQRLLTDTDQVEGNFSFSQLMLVLFFEELWFATTRLGKHSSGVMCHQQTMSQKSIMKGVDLHPMTR